ncbi:hypothetical protein FQZ97_923220 [compost metagenome]
MRDRIICTNEGQNLTQVGNLGLIQLFSQSVLEHLKATLSGKAGNIHRSARQTPFRQQFCPAHCICRGIIDDLCSTALQGAIRDIDLLQILIVTTPGTNHKPSSGFGKRRQHRRRQKATGKNSKSPSAYFGHVNSPFNR